MFATKFITFYTVYTYETDLNLYIYNNFNFYKCYLLFFILYIILFFFKFKIFYIFNLKNYSLLNFISIFFKFFDKIFLSESVIDYTLGINSDLLLYIDDYNYKKLNFIDSIKNFFLKIENKILLLFILFIFYIEETYIYKVNEINNNIYNEVIKKYDKYTILSFEKWKIYWWMEDFFKKYKTLLLARERSIFFLIIILIYKFLKG